MHGETTDSLATKLEELHKPVEHTYTFWHRFLAAMANSALRYGPYCRECGQAWPCRTILLVHPELAIEHTDMG